MDESLQLLAWETPPVRARAESIANTLSRRDRSVTVQTIPVTAAADPVGTAFLEPTSSVPEPFRRRLVDGNADLGVLPLPVGALQTPLRLAAVCSRSHGEDWLVAAEDISLASADIVPASTRIRTQLAAAYGEDTLRPVLTDETPETAIADVRTTALQRTAASKRAADDDAFTSWHETLSAAEQAALDRAVEDPVDGLVAPAAAVAPAVPAAMTTKAVSPEPLCPAPAQGTLGVVTSQAPLVDALRPRLDDPLTRIETTTERVLATAVPASLPLGVTATVRGAFVATQAWIGRAGGPPVTETYEFPIQRYRQAAQQAGEALEARLTEA